MGEIQYVLHSGESHITCGSCGHQWLQAVDIEIKAMLDPSVGACGFPPCPECGFVGGVLDLSNSGIGNAPPMKPLAHMRSFDDVAYNIKCWLAEYEKTPCQECCGDHHLEEILDFLESTETQ